jgi:SRSO17 transposase
MGSINTVYSRECGRKRKIVALVTTDLDATPAQIIQACGRRWAIERFFRAAKQDLGMGHYQGRHWEGVDQHLQLVLVAYLLLSSPALGAKRFRQQASPPKETPCPASRN